MLPACDAVPRRVVRGGVLLPALPKHPHLLLFSLHPLLFSHIHFPPPRSLSTPPSHPQENWQLVGETLNVYRENEEVVYKGDSPGQFMGFTTKTYDLYDPAVNKEACKKGGEGFPYNKDKGCPVAKATIRKGCWFVFCAFWKKEVRGNGGGWGK